MSLDREAVSPASPPLGDQRKASGLDESEIEMTLNPTFLETPPIVSMWPSSITFDELGEASLGDRDNTLSKGLTLTPATSIAALTTLGGFTPKIPLAFPKFFLEETMRTDLRGSRVSIMSSLFNVSPMRGGVSSLVFPISSPFVDPHLGSADHAGNITFVASSSPPLLHSSFSSVSSTGKMCGFVPFVGRPFDASGLPSPSSSHPTDSSLLVDSFREVRAMVYKL